MVKGPKKYNTSSGNCLKAKLNEVVVKCMAEKQYYQSRVLKILIGLSKIFHAVALMYVYAWQMPFKDKMPVSLALCITGTLTYLIEYGISVFWWNGYFAKFSKDNSPTHNLIVCSSTPWYSNIYHIKIYLKQSSTFFQKLGEPSVEAEFKFQDYFTESGYCLEHKFASKINSLIDQALYPKTK